MAIELSKILAHFPNERQAINDPSVLLDGVISFLQARNNAALTKISWINETNAKTANPNELNVGLLLLSLTSYDLLKSAACNFLIVSNPRAAFFSIVKEFFVSSKRETKVESSAVIHPTCKVGNGCYIGHGVILEENCVVGNNTVILHNTCLLSGTKVGNNVLIGCNNTIGNYGFGYEKDDQGDYGLLEHIGHVIIHDAVEIHNNTCIDRGVLDNTEIHENVKIDNLVHIAHGVVIERNSLVIANAMIAGSTRVGQNSWVAPSASLKNKITIAPNTLIGIGSVVLKDTQQNETYIGNPAITLTEHKKRSEAKKKTD
jgi:UDP-3-O-[3-hydroxymyristoyl] glucosamine N-acyltransferase